MGDFNTGEPLGFIITWRAYGTWLPGDERGYVKWHEGWHPPSKKLKENAEKRMVESAVQLTQNERTKVEETVRRHCAIRGWTCWEVNARTTHVHTVITAMRPTPDAVRDQLKAWCTRELREHGDTRRRHWWAEGGSTRCLNDEESLERAIVYTRDAQDLPHD